MRLYSQLAPNLGLLFQFTQLTSEGQYKIEIYVAPHNETDIGVINKNVVTVEEKNRKFPQLIAIGVNL